MKRNLLTRTPVIAMAVALVAGTAGCSVNSPFQTAKTQSLADGVAADLEGAEVRNLALVSGEAGGDATVTGAVANTSGQEMTFTVAVPGGSKATTKIAPHKTLSLSSDGDKITLTKVKAGPGEMVTVEVSNGSASTPVGVPVLAPNGYYEDYAPDGWTPSPTPSSSSTSSSH